MHLVYLKLRLGSLWNLGRCITLFRILVHLRARVQNSVQSKRFSYQTDTNAWTAGLSVLIFTLILINLLYVVIDPYHSHIFFHLYYNSSLIWTQTNACVPYVGMKVLVNVLSLFLRYLLVSFFFFLPCECLDNMWDAFSYDSCIGRTVSLFFCNKYV